jgi:hypothetical protein
MPKFIGAPQLVLQRTYLSGEFRGKFKGALDLAKSDLSRENFYDLQFLNGEANVAERNVRTWPRGEDNKFVREPTFHTPLLNPLLCNISFLDGTTKHYDIHLYEPKILNPKLINQVYEGQDLFTTIDGEISGYITHYGLGGTVVELPPEPEPIIIPAYKAPKPKFEKASENIDVDKMAAEFGSVSSASRPGCSSVTGEGCATGCGTLFLISLAVLLLLSFGLFLNGLRNGTSSSTSTSPNNSTIPEDTESGTSDREDSKIGQRGRFTTNEHLRSRPNVFSPSLGIHFKDARFTVRDEKRSGGSVWYKVFVTEYGCDAKSALGCGKNSPEDYDEGWLNGKYVLLDQ